MYWKFEWRDSAGWSDFIPKDAFVALGPSQLEHVVASEKTGKSVLARCAVWVDETGATLDYSDESVSEHNTLVDVELGLLEVLFADENRDQIAHHYWHSEVVGHCGEGKISEVASVSELAKSSHSNSHPFTVGKDYSRRDVAAIIGLPYSGGNWDTGYPSYDGAHYIFCNVGTSGRTGHDYANRWHGHDLIWFGKTNTTRASRQIKAMTQGNPVVHVFWRASDKSAFTYAGLGTAIKMFNEKPLGVIWTFGAATIESPQDSKLTFRRGPPPTDKEYGVVIEAGPSYVYLMTLRGAAALYPHLPTDQTVCKIGMSSSPIRRLSQLNYGFPNGSEVRWEIHSVKFFSTSRNAFDWETRVLEHLRRTDRWIGGEYARVPGGLLDGLIDTGARN